MTLSKRRLWLLAAAMVWMTPSGCGGGGGGGGGTRADVQGVVLLTTTGQPPNPPATVNIGGIRRTTDASGNFLLQGVPAPATQMTITATGVQTLTQALPPLAARPALNDLGNIFVVPTGTTYTAKVTGRVVRADTLEALPNARVLLSGQITLADASGLFRFENLPVGLGGPGVVVGKITATGFEEKTLFIDPPLVAGDNPLGDIPVAPPVGGLPGGPTNIRGTIALQGQTDFSGVVVALINRADLKVLGSQTTGADGKYGFWVVAGQYTVRAERGGFQTKTQNVDLPRPDQPQTVDMTLTP